MDPTSQCVHVWGEHRLRQEDRRMQVVPMFVQGLNTCIEQLLHGCAACSHLSTATMSKATMGSVKV